MARLLHLSLVGLLLGVILTSPPALGDRAPGARGTDAESLLQEGVAAFNHGDLELARGLLEAARASGLESSALRYNLGVLYYRLERYDLSRQAFRELLKSRHDAVARYNLGLVAQSQGRDQEARDWFYQVYETAEQEKLRRLARIQLDKEPVSALSDPGSRIGFASLGAGYEDNLALRPDSVATGLSDNFNELLLAGQGPVMNLGGSTGADQALHLSGSLFRRHYHSQDDFTSDAARLGLSWVSSSARNRQEVGLRQSYFRLGDESRELHTSLLFKYRRNGCGPEGRCELSLLASRVTPFDGFEAYEGMRYLASADYRHDWNQWRGSARLIVEFNERENIAEGDQSVSVSPRRQEVVLGLDYRGWQPWTLGGELGYQYSDYPDPYQLVASTDVESGPRADHLYTAELAAEYALSRAWSATGAATYRSNDSSLRQYRYDNQVYQVSLDYLF